MKAANQVGTGAGEGPRQLVSPLEQTLDAAVESERHRWVRAARDRAELIRVTPHPGRAALAVGNTSEAGPLSQRRPAPLLASMPAPLLASMSAPLPASRPASRGARAKSQAVGQRRASEAKGWLQLCAVWLGLFAIVMAFKWPVSPRMTAPALEQRAPTPPAASATERAVDVPASAAVITTVEPRQVPAKAEEVPAKAEEVPAKAEEVPAKAEEVPAEPVTQTAMLQPSEPSRAGAPARRALDSEAARSAVAPVPPAPAPRASAVPAAQRAQAGAAHALPAKRADVVTVDDMFGIGGDEPLPPEALETPTPTAPTSRASKPPRAASAAMPSLFYEKPPF